MFIKTLVLMVLSTASTCNAQDKPYCTENNIKRAEIACNKAYGGLSGSDLTPICGRYILAIEGYKTFYQSSFNVKHLNTGVYIINKNPQLEILFKTRLDCVLQCLKEAVSDCWKTDQFFNYDLHTTVVRYRAMCEDLEKTKRAQDACNPTSCEQQYLQPNHTATMRELYNKGDFAGYKQLECSRARDTLNCIPTAAVGPNCTTELAKLSKGIETVRFSMSECGNAQDHEFFKTYADKGTPCTNPAINNKCLLTSLTKRASKCLEVAGLSSGSSELIARVCPDIECNLKCYLDAIGDCYKEERLFSIDPKIIKVIGRATCDNKQGTESPLSLCPVNNQTCSNEFNSAWAEASTHLMKGDYTEFKRILCRASQDIKACIGVSITDNCTSSTAEQARNMYQVSYSYAACGPQDQTYFTKYGGDVNCVTSADSRLIGSIFKVVSLTVILMLWV